MDEVQTPSPFVTHQFSFSNGVSSKIIENSHQYLSCDSSRSNFSTYESLDLQSSDCSDLAKSLPSCTSENLKEEEEEIDEAPSQSVISLEQELYMGQQTYNPSELLDQRVATYSSNTSKSRLTTRCHQFIIEINFQVNPASSITLQSTSDKDVAQATVDSSIRPTRQ